MSEFIDFDPQTGVSHWWDYDAQTDKATITTRQDIEPILDWTKNAANQGLTDGGIKESWWLYAKIPTIYQVKMHQAGIKLNDPGATKRIIQWVNEHAPHLKCTTKQHGGTKPKIYLPNATD